MTSPTRPRGAHRFLQAADRRCRRSERSSSSPTTDRWAGGSRVPSSWSSPPWYLLVWIRRCEDRPAGRIAGAVGMAAVVVGVAFLPHLVKRGSPAVAVAAVVEHGRRAGAPWRWCGARVPRPTGGPPSRDRRRCAGCLAVTAMTVTPSIMATNVPRPDIGATPESRDLPFTDVELTTTDGVRLAAWYVPSTNRAAVVLLHGAGSTRSNVLDHAEVLARHGFGVLMVDARGHGESGGRAMDFGWFGDADIAAATAFLAARPDVDRDRIGAVGLSMGGEEAIGAAATDRRLRAVVAEGATARVAADEAWLSDEYGVRGVVQEQLERVQDVVTDLLTERVASDLAPRSGPRRPDRRFLLIAAGRFPRRSRPSGYLAVSGAGPRPTWTVAGAGHTEGLCPSPRRVGGAGDLVPHARAPAPHLTGPWADGGGRRSLPPHRRTGARWRHDHPSPPPIDVLLLESHPHVGDRAAGDLEAAGHRVHRCYARRRATLHCVALAEDGRCPIDDGIDVAVLVRRPARSRCPRTSRTACCAPATSRHPHRRARPGAPGPVGAVVDVRLDPESTELASVRRVAAGVDAPAWTAIRRTLAPLLQAAASTRRPWSAGSSAPAPAWPST